MDIDIYRNKWWIMVAVSLTLFMGAVDGTIVNVALPTLAAEFNASFATVQWVVLAFLLGLSVLLLSVGRLADMAGKKRIFAAGLVVFVVGSVLCGLAARAAARRAVGNLPCRAPQRALLAVLPNPARMLQLASGA